MATEAGVEALGGAIGSCLSLTATYPLLAVSTWQALQHTDVEGDEQALLSQLWFIPSPLKEVLVYGRTKGWRALYGGLRPNLVATALSQGLYFYFYSTLRQGIVAQQQARQGAALPGSARTSDIGVTGSVVVAGLAGCANAILTHPLWGATLQMQNNYKSGDLELRKKGVVQIMRERYQEGGVRQLWQGLPAALIMVSNPTIQFILYEWLSARLLDLRRRAAAKAGSSKRPSLNPGDAFLLSAVAKLGATLCTYPVLLIKSRLQAASAATAAEARYTGVLDAVACILRSEGLAGLFKGLKVKMVQTVLAAALLMSIKEQVYRSTRLVLALASQRQRAAGHATAH